MKHKDLEAFALSLPGAALSIKWGDDRCYTVGAKMFAATGAMKPNAEARVSFKCSDLSFELLTKRKGLIPAPYLARAKWVMLEDPKALSAEEIRARLAEAHRLVLESLPKKTQAAILGAAPTATSLSPPRGRGASVRGKAQAAPSARTQRASKTNRKN